MSTYPPKFAPVRDVRVAVSFLSRIPTGWIQDLSASDLSKAAWAFPVVGILIGGLGGAALYGSAALDLHPLGCAFIGVGVTIFLSGAMHEDGLADVADGLGGFTRSRTLEIMRDSRIGSYGVIALIMSIGIKVAVLSSVPGPGLAWLGLIAAATFSRSIMPMVMALMPPARTDGLSKNAGRPMMKVAAFSLAIGLVALFAIMPMWNAGIAIALTLPFVGLVVYWAWTRLRGQTGDVLGAVQQVTEVAVLMAAASWSFEFEL